MGSLNKEMMFLVLQFLEEEDMKEALHTLEKESRLYFNLKYFEERILAGDWDETEKYLSGFTKIRDNRYSMKMFFEIRKQKYFEALDRRDKAAAVEILVKDLKIFSTYNEQLYKEIAHLITLEDFRQNEQLAQYGDAISTRKIMIAELKKLIDLNPCLIDKLRFPTINSSRLQYLVNQSLNWQHMMCKNPKLNPEIETLFTDHICPPPPKGPQASTSTWVPSPREAANRPILGPFQPPSLGILANPVPLPAWMLNGNPSSSSQPSSAAATSLLPGPSNQASALTHSRLNTLALMDFQSIELDQQLRRLPPPQNIGINGVPYAGTPQAPHRLYDEFPCTVVCKFYLGSDVSTLNFHPYIYCTLAVGTANGQISIWDVKLREKLFTKSFKIWNISECSAAFQAATSNKEYSMCVNRVLWSPDANYFGVAFEKHLVQLYTFKPPCNLQKHLEEYAHEGSVNDIAFSYPKEDLCLVTCGDDKLIKVWDLEGKNIYTFTGHVAPVYSVLPHSKENVQFLFSTSVDGKIRVWVYDNEDFQVEYDTPGKCGATMIYSTDRTRLFSCGTSKDGSPFLVEWSESEGKVKRHYAGFRNKSAGIVQFDTAKDRYLAAGVDNHIRIWNMDFINVLTFIDADGGLSNLPRLKFNRGGNLLAVTTADAGLKILANIEGRKLLETTESPKEPIDSKDGILLSLTRNMDTRNLEDDSKAWELIEIVHPVQCRVATMPDGMDSNDKVSRLLYSKNGVSLVALSSKGIQKMWKWKTDNESNPTGKATASVVPQHWSPRNGVLMTNDVPENCDSAIPCMDVSKNDSYIIAACGGKVSLFNSATFKVLYYFMQPPPATTFLAFNPQDNNIIAVGREDSDIHIFNVRFNEIRCKLKGHQKYITGITFSPQMNIMVSASADAQIFSWCTRTWKKKNSVTIQMPNSENAPVGETTVQFHCDQVRFLVCHETQLAIYDASKMELIRKWLPQNGLSGSISSATYSCNGQLVFATFTDGNIGIFDSYNLILLCRIASSAYMNQTPSDSPIVYPLVVTAHPEKPKQFAIGLTDGSVMVFEPKEEDWWTKKVVKMDMA